MPKIKEFALGLTKIFSQIQTESGSECWKNQIRILSERSEHATLHHNTGTVYCTMLQFVQQFVSENIARLLVLHQAVNSCTCITIKLITAFYTLRPIFRQPFQQSCGVGELPPEPAQFWLEPQPPWEQPGASPVLVGAGDIPNKTFLIILYNKSHYF